MIVVVRIQDDKDMTVQKFYARQDFLMNITSTTAICVVLERDTVFTYGRPSSRFGIVSPMPEKLVNICAVRIEHDRLVPLIDRSIQSRYLIIFYVALA